MRKLICTILIGAMIVPILPACGQLTLPPIGSAPAASTIAQTSGPGFTSVTIGDDYILDAGDKLEAHVIVGENAMVFDYNFAVNAEGAIYFPSVGEIPLAGLNLKQAKIKIKERIKNAYREKFDLLLTVSEPKKIGVYVTGQIEQTGLYNVYDGTRMADILKLVGMAKGGSDLSEYVYLKRKDQKGELKEERYKLLDVFTSSREDQNTRLRNGDIVSVPSIKSYVYIYGEVARSGTFGYVPGESLSDYINIAGGPTPRALLGSVTVTRIEDGKPKVINVNVSDILQRGIKKNDIEIFAGDVISVPGNFFYFSDFASFANTVLLALTLYNTAKK